MSPADLSLRAEVVVVGTGAGGAPAAAALAEAGHEVLLLEAGPRLSAADFGEDEGAMRSRLGRLASSEDALQSFFAGACVGGSTVINDALCWRPPPEVLEGWEREHGLPAAELGPRVERIWRDVHAEATAPRNRNRNARLLERGAQRLSWAGEWMPRNVRSCANLGRCNLGCPIDAKQSMLVSTLPRAERAGARIVPDARVDRVLVEAGRVRGVVGVALDPATRRPRATLRAEARLVILAAGALETAPLLLRSGLTGPVGRGFQAHSSSTVTARFREPVHGYFGPTMAYAISEFSDVGGHAGPGYMLENAGVRPLQTASVVPGFGEAHERVMAQLPHLAHTVVVLRDRTRGRLSLRPDGSAALHHALEPRDLDTLRHAFGTAARAYLAAGAEEVWLPVHGWAPVRRHSDLEALAASPLDRTRLALLYAVHLFGGASIGSSPRSSTCSPEGRVWNVAGLYVSDAAALPSNTGVNPQITIMANALRTAEIAAAEIGS